MLGAAQYAVVFPLRTDFLSKETLPRAKDYPRKRFPERRNIPARRPAVVCLTGQRQMTRYLRFLLIGLVLGLFTEIELKLIAGIKPSAFIVAVFVYPVLVSLSYMASKFIDRLVSSTWRGDLLHYGGAGLGGLAFEWVLLGNGPGSNAIQLGMFAMWTTFCFGPRVLTRDSCLIEKAGRRFWMAFGIAAVLLTASVLMVPGPGPRIVIAVLGLSGTYMIWSGWLLILAWRTRQPARIEEATAA